LHAYSDFDLPTSSFLNKNYLFRFDISIESSSVQYNFPFYYVHAPIKANNLRYSHPSAPAPTKNIFLLAIFYYNSYPKTAI